MVLYKKILIAFYWVSTRLKLDLSQIKRIVWNKYLFLWWCCLWIRKNEFHYSLNMDAMAMIEMDKKEMKKYLVSLDYRRKIAHERALEAKDNKKD